MMERIVGAALLAAVLGLGAGAMAIWTRIIGRWSAGEPAVPYEPRRAVPWDTLDIVVVAVIVMLSIMAPAAIVRWRQPANASDQAVADETHVSEASSASEPAAEESGGLSSSSGAEEIETEDERSKSSQSARRLKPGELPMLALSRVLGPLFALVYVRLRSGASWSDLGFDLSHFGGDVRLGLLAFVAIAIPIYALQFLLQVFFPGRNPMIDLAVDHPQAWVLVSIAVLAVGIAPITEELIFRVILQGWLERLELSVGPEHPLRRLPHGVMPIVLAAGCFAVLHAGSGPDPAPIFVLALALGYVYQRTHRIWPSLTVHVTLNGISTLILLTQVGLGLEA